VTHRIEGPFDVTRTPETVHAAAEGMLGRHALHKVYRGTLDARGVGEMLSVGTPNAGSAGYVAIETVTGTLDGRRGSFCLQHTGVMARGSGSLTITVIPDSGTDELAGLSGQMQIAIENGRHSYVFDYEL